LCEYVGQKRRKCGNSSVLVAPPKQARAQRAKRKGAAGSRRPKAASGAQSAAAGGGQHMQLLQVRAKLNAIFGSAVEVLAFATNIEIRGTNRDLLSRNS
jgi:hypothetical protein